MERPQPSGALRRSNTLNGALTGLAACGAITDREAQAYRFRLSSFDRGNAWKELAARFGLHEPEPGRFIWYRPLRVQHQY